MSNLKYDPTRLHAHEDIINPIFALWRRLETMDKNEIDIFQLFGGVASEGEVSDAQRVAVLSISLGKLNSHILLPGLTRGEDFDRVGDAAGLCIYLIVALMKHRGLNYSELVDSLSRVGRAADMLILDE